MRARGDSKGDGLQAAPGSRNVTESLRTSFREAEQNNPPLRQKTKPRNAGLFLLSERARMRARGDSKGDGLQAAPGARNVIEPFVLNSAQRNQ
jgi:hypothetical protein